MLDINLDKFYTEQDYWDLMEFAVYNSWIGCIIANHEGKYIYANKIYEEITGVPKKVINELDAYHSEKEYQLNHNSSVLLALKEKRDIVLEQHTTPLNRKIIVRGTPFFDNNGKVKYVLSQLIDVERLNIIRNKITLKEAKKNWEDFEKVETKATLFRGASIDYAVYKSDIMCKIMAQARLVANSEATVLLLGKSGTGKELVARYIHQASVRSEGPFLKINCSAIPENLLESELFGYEAGSFTGGITGGKKGLLEYANGGTVLLDEIGDMPLNLQAKILRVLQEKEIMRIGGNVPIKLNVRFIASTNVNIPNLIKEKKFRSDLYYRLNIAPIRIPTLKERKEDIPLLIDYFLSKFNQTYNANKAFHVDLVRHLTNIPMDGNIRELRNIIERLFIMIPKNEITLTDFLELDTGEEEVEVEVEDNNSNAKNFYKFNFEDKSLVEILADFEEYVLREFKRKYKKNVDIANALKTYPATITRKLQKYRIK